MSNWPNFVCSNPNCSSYGKSHPNCRCEGPGQPDPDDHYSSYASGGAVHYCSHSKAHEPNCEHYAEGGIVRDNQEFENNPDLSVDHAIANNGLLHTMQRTGYTKSDEPGRAAAEFLESSRKGKKKIESHSNSLLGKGSISEEPDKERLKELETKLLAISNNPDAAAGTIGGNLGKTHLMHHALLGYKVGSAANYVNAIKPRPSQAGPLDPEIPPTRAQERAYMRQLALVEKPTHIYEHAQNRMLQPQDFQTVNTLYPKLRTAMSDKAFETLASSRVDGRNLTHHQKRKLSAIMGEPLTYQQTPAASQAILKANAMSQPPPTPAKPTKKATNVELKQINKVNELSETPLQKLQTSRNS